jgi:uncharacterized protein YjbJ (UPF0337 family)
MDIRTDPVKGQAKAVHGKLEEVGGKVVGNASSERKGDVQQKLDRMRARFGGTRAGIKDGSERA